MPEPHQSPHMIAVKRSIRTWISWKHLFLSQMLYSHFKSVNLMHCKTHSQAPYFCMLSKNLPLESWRYVSKTDVYFLPYLKMKYKVTVWPKNLFLLDQCWLLTGKFKNARSLLPSKQKDFLEPLLGLKSVSVIIFGTNFIFEQTKHNVICLGFHFSY